MAEQESLKLKMRVRIPLGPPMTFERLNNLILFAGIFVMFWVVPWAMAGITLFLILIMPHHNGKWWVIAYWEEYNMSIKCYKVLAGAKKLGSYLFKKLPLDRLR